MEANRTIWKHKKEKSRISYSESYPFAFNEFLSPLKPSHHSAIDTIEVFLQTSTLKTSINGE